MSNILLLAANPWWLPLGALVGLLIGISIPWIYETMSIVDGEQEPDPHREVKVPEYHPETGEHYTQAYGIEE